MADETYVFGSFQLVPAQRLLLNRGRSLPLGSRALEILITLVECAGDTVSKDQLIGRVWPDTVVDEGALRVHVAAAREPPAVVRALLVQRSYSPGPGCLR